MGQIKECFVCGTLLAMAEDKLLDVARPDGTRRPRPACGPCYYKAVAHGWVMATHDGMVYKCRARTMQRDLFGRTYRKLTANGGRDV